MNKIYVSIILLFFLITNTNSEIIKEVSVKGNNRITTDTILIFGNIKLNEDVDENKINTILKNLYKTNFFENIKIQLKNNTLYLDVIENPLVQSVSFNGVKNKKILELLNEIIELKEKTSFIKTKVNKDQKRITNVLRTNGYYQAKVISKFVENSNNTIDLIYNIELGNRASIKKIKFIGDKKVKDRTLRKVITSEEDKFWKFITSNKFIDDKRIKLDERLLKNYYKNNGYYNVVVESSTVQIINESDFILTFNINSGKKYFFNNFKLNLPEEFSQKSFAKIINLFNKLKGKKYSLNKIEKILDEIDKIALNKDFEFIDATFNEQILNNNKINLTINLFESEKFYIERINIFGNYITEERVIRNTLLIDEGDALNKILLNKSLNQIKSTNIFKEVVKNIRNGSNSKQKIVDINVDEKPTGEIYAGIGTGTQGTSVNFGIRENNYLGKGVLLNTNITLAEEKTTGIFYVETPNYKNTNKTANASVEISELDKMSGFGYKSTKHGFNFGLRYEQYEDIYFSPSFSTYYETLKTSSQASSSKKKQEGSYLDTEFKYGFTLNKLNQNFQPSEGYKSSFTQSLPVFTEDQTIINTFKIAKFYPLKDEMIFSIRFLAKTANSLADDEDVRISKRIFLPESKLRGFGVGKIGPKDSGEFIGGNYASALNFNTTLPKIFSDFEEMDFNLFFDMANVWGVDYNSSLDESKLRSSTGLSIDWFTPIGPLSFSLAVPISKADTDSTETFRFNIGTTF